MIIAGRYVNCREHLSNNGFIYQETKGEEMFNVNLFVSVIT